MITVYGFVKDVSELADSCGGAVVGSIGVLATVELFGLVHVINKLLLDKPFCDCGGNSQE